jgi:preprotein translocase subunit SecA
VNFIKKLFSPSRREVKQARVHIGPINEAFEALRDISDDELRAKTVEFRERLEAGETLDDIMVEAFAVVKETMRRFAEKGITWDVVGVEQTWFMIPFDVQLIGAIKLHEGRITEMATGEGKTLVAVMPLYLNALEGKGSHLVTVNDFLAKRDANWMGPICHWLGLSLAVLQDPNANDGVEALRIEYNEEQSYHLVSVTRREAYRCDITYGRQDQFGFDYLYDNMAWDLNDLRHRGFSYAIVDEADQLLIDEARTPLIISGQVPESRDQIYHEIRPMIDRLVKDQARVVAGLVDEGEQLWNDGEEYAAGLKLFQAQRGAPRQRKLMRLREEVGIQKILQRVESDLIRDKRVSEIDEEALLYMIDEKQHQAEITENGRSTLAPNQAEMLVLPNLSEEVDAMEHDESLEPAQRQAVIQKAYSDYGKVAERIHAASNLLRAYALFENDVNYVVQDDKVVIVDEFTGRMQPGRRFSDGLHQALEAKENVTVERDTQTVATITVQNYFRMYSKLAGMTGTAETEEDELFEIYKLPVVVIPTNRPIRRDDMDDVIFKTRREKYNSVVDEIERLNTWEIPVLIGTRSVEVSELLSRMLQRKGIKHSVLNAKYHQQESEIISNAGQPAAVTIATNMAGRGTDIKLHPSIVRETVVTDPEHEDYDADEQGGLRIIGTERHDARRIDRQLRGRSGRQGDPGASQIFISLEDDLMRLFGSDRIARLMDTFGAEEGEVIQSPMVTKAIDRAQKRVETSHFEVRKRLIDYDDVMTQQREVIYDRRRFALEHDNLHEEIVSKTEILVDDLMFSHIGEEIPPEEWNIDGLRVDIAKTFGAEPQLDSDDPNEPMGEEHIRARILEGINQRYEDRRESLRTEADRVGLEDRDSLINRLEKVAILATIDDRWREHLTDIDDMKGGIHLRAYGQKDPVVEFKREAYDMFEALISEIDRQTLEMVFKSQLPSEREVEQRRLEAEKLRASHADYEGSGGDGDAPVVVGEAEVKTAGPGARKRVSRPKARLKAPPADGAPGAAPATAGVSRNAPCPCGSGKKYKYCHGKNT